MIRDRIKRAARRVKRGVARRLGRDEQVVQATASAPLATSTPAPSAPVPPPAPEPEPEPVTVAPTEPETSPHPPMNMETVTALFEDMVRPALQSDGGDIELLKVEDDSVHVRLVGACSTCPSSTVTMKMGVERLLEEEFPQFRSLVQVPA